MVTTIAPDLASGLSGTKNLSIKLDRHPRRDLSNLVVHET